MTNDRNARRVVLLVDDEDLFRMTLRAALEAQLTGVDVLEAGDGREALEILAKERVDCVVTDLRMEGMSGVELLSEMLLRGYAAPTVVVSAWASAAPSLEEAVECIAKPVDLYVLCRRVDALLRADPPRARVTLPGIVHVLACEGRTCEMRIEASGGRVAILFLERGAFVDASVSTGDAHDPILGIAGALEAFDWDPSRMTVLRVATARPRNTPPPLGVVMSLAGLHAQLRARARARVS